MGKYLIAGLGNPGEEYAGTRHNIGFTILDSLCGESNIFFNPGRLAFTAEYKFKGKFFLLIKPTTFMNLSGKAVNYWLQASKIPLENLLVITDDLALPFGSIRIRANGSDGGHNGLKSIQETLGTDQYARMRFGIGNDFPKGYQSDYVLGKWSPGEEAALVPRIRHTVEAIKSFGTIGLQRTMTFFNNK